MTLGIGGPVADTNDSVELSTQTTAPGVLKIFGGEISSGANYKSVLATPMSSARVRDCWDVEINGRSS